MTHKYHLEESPAAKPAQGHHVAEYLFWAIVICGLLGGAIAGHSAVSHGLLKQVAIVFGTGLAMTVIVVCAVVCGARADRRQAGE